MARTANVWRATCGVTSTRQLHFLPMIQRLSRMALYLSLIHISMCIRDRACNGMAEDCRNILYDVFIDKTLALLDAEAEILKEMLRHGTVSAGFHAEAVRGSGSKSSVTLTWNGTDLSLIHI